MAFASIHIPGFLIQAVMRSEPGRNHAIALVDGAPPNLNVIAASKAVFQAGIQLGMTKSQASQFCAVEIRHRSEAQEKAAHAALLDLGWSMSPRIEDTAVDTVLIDVAGLDSLFGSVENISNELADRAAKAYEKSMTLPVPMRDPKMLLKLLRLHLQSDPPAAPILKVSLVAEPARPRAAQGGLFLPSSPDPEKLELTVARLRNLIGDSNVGSPELLDTHRADEFRMACFFPPAAASNTLKNKKTIRSESRPTVLPETHGTQNKRPPLTAFRVFRPALPANVEMRGEYPARVSFNGLRASVTAVSGPWRTSGDWWRENAWHQDEWELELRFDAAADSTRQKKRGNAKYLKGSQDGVYRLYFDSICQGWFVRGIYD